jgi:putative ABC transport system substrate-binding protein
MSFGVEPIVAPVHDTTELDTVIGTQARVPNAGLILVPDSFLVSQRSKISALATRYQLPVAGSLRVFTEAGILLSYGNDLVDNYRRAAIYTDRILKGIKPSDLPVQAPVKFELVVNANTAKALGLTIPSSFYWRADEILD